MGEAILIGLTIFAVFGLASSVALLWSRVDEYRDAVLAEVGKVRAEDRKAYESEWGLVRGRLALLESTAKPKNEQATPRKPRMTMAEVRALAERQSQEESGNVD